MNKIVHYISLDVHKETIAVSIAPQNSIEVRRYGIIGGTLDAVDKLIKRLSRPNRNSATPGPRALDLKPRRNPGVRWSDLILPVTHDS